MDTNVEPINVIPAQLLYDIPEVQGILMRLAHEIYAKLHQEQAIAIVGILRRGAPLADILYHELSKSIPSRKIIRIDIKAKRYSDDLSILYPNTLLTVDPLLESCNLTDYHLLVVDDVLYTGRSMLKVVEFLQSKNPKAISTVCLVDRLNPQVPIVAQFCGIKLQLNDQMIVECHIPPYESNLQIRLATKAGVIELSKS